MSNVGLWDSWYKDVTEREPYIDTATYQMGADYLEDCETVEDWGCGKGWFRNYRPDGYKGIDGSYTPFADVVADLITYEPDPKPEGIYMRGVIEHNFQWAPLLDNALRSFTKKMCLVLFTPLAEETTQIAMFDYVPVPDISFSLAELQEHFDAAGVTVEMDLDLPSTTAYGVEHVFYITRP